MTLDWDEILEGYNSVDSEHKNIKYNYAAIDESGDIWLFEKEPQYTEKKTWDFKLRERNSASKLGSLGYSITEEESKASLVNLNNLKRMTVEDFKFHVRQRWTHQSLIKEDENLFEIHTGGIENNEIFVKQILKTRIAKMYLIAATKGGHYYFQFPPGTNQIKKYRIVKDNTDVFVPINYTGSESEKSMLKKGVYLVELKDGERYLETFNGTGWAYNNELIVKFWLPRIKE